MKETFQAIKVSNHVYWVGAIDWGIRDFHGYYTDRGTTYNAYLITGEKVTLIDVVKAPFKDEMLSRIASVIDPEQIDFIVSNHAEMDHSGCLQEIIETVKPSKVFASRMGVRALNDHFRFDREIIPVNDGENLSLGNLTLSFMETRMLHWPDSMFSYLIEEGVLFSQDAFGMHIASSERFDSDIGSEILVYEASKYFANILLPYSALVTKLLASVKKTGLQIKIIAPDHGPIWRKDLNMILDLYGKWAAQEPTDKAVVVYDTMWKSTDLMAQSICEGLMDGGIQVKVMPLKAFHRSDVATEILDSGALLAGSPTLNNNVYPTMMDVLTYMRGLKPRNLIGAAFGSYGWSGEAVEQINEILRAMKVDLVNDGLKVKYVPDKEALTECFSLGSLVAEKLKGFRK